MNSIYHLHATWKQSRKTISKCFSYPIFWLFYLDNVNSSNISSLNQCPGSATYSKQVNKLYFKIQKHKKDKTAQTQQHWIQWLVNSTFLPFLNLQGNHQNSFSHSEQWGRKWYLVTKASSLVHEQQVCYNFLNMLEYTRRGPQRHHYNSSDYQTG